MKPPKLQSGDKVAIISPSNTIAEKKDLVEKARQNFELATGLVTVLAPNALGRHYYSSGTPGERLDDFHWALKDPEIKAIVFSVGGSTAVDLVGGLDYELIKQNPKIIAGISDASTLLNAIATKTGLITFHGIEFLDFGKEDMSYTVASIKKAWFEGEIGKYSPNPTWHDFDGRPTSYKEWEVIKPGIAQGKVVGGNFRCFMQLRGTEYFLDSFKDTILVMEAYKWPKRHLHQALVNAKLWGVLDQISGLVVGYCLGSDSPNHPGDEQSMKDLVVEVTDGYDFPAMWIGEIGHNIENFVLPIGAQAKLDADDKSFEIIESVLEVND